MINVRLGSNVTFYLYFYEISTIDIHHKDYQMLNTQEFGIKVVVYFSFWENKCRLTVSVMGKL